MSIAFISQPIKKHPVHIELMLTMLHLVSQPRRLWLFEHKYLFFSTAGVRGEKRKRPAEDEGDEEDD